MNPKPNLAPEVVLKRMKFLEEHLLELIKGMGATVTRTELIELWNEYASLVNGVPSPTPKLPQ